MIRQLESKSFLFFLRDHLRSTLGITCGRGSFAVHFGDHLRSRDHLRLGIICGTVQYFLEFLVGVCRGVLQMLTYFRLKNILHKLTYLSIIRLHDRGFSCPFSSTSPAARNFNTANELQTEMTKTADLFFPVTFERTK